MAQIKLSKSTKVQLIIDAVILGFLCVGYI